MKKNTVLFVILGLLIATMAWAGFYVNFNIRGTYTPTATVFAVPTVQITIVPDPLSYGSYPGNLISVVGGIPATIEQVLVTGKNASASNITVQRGYASTTPQALSTTVYYYINAFVADTPLNTVTNTCTNTATNTATSTPTLTVTQTGTLTPTYSPTVTPTFTSTNTSTATNTATNTPTSTSTLTATNTPTVTNTPGSPTPTETVTDFHVQSGSTTPVPLFTTGSALYYPLNGLTLTNSSAATALMGISDGAITVYYHTLGGGTGEAFPYVIPQSATGNTWKLLNPSGAVSIEASGWTHGANTQKLDNR